MTTPKHKELTVQIAVTLKVGYNQSDLDEMGKTFREFKHGVETVVRQDILPAFQKDEHCEVEVLTVGFPSRAKLERTKKTKVKL